MHLHQTLLIVLSTYIPFCVLLYFFSCTFTQIWDHMKLKLTITLRVRLLLIYVMKIMGHMHNYVVNMKGMQSISISSMVCGKWLSFIESKNQRQLRPFAVHHWNWIAWNTTQSLLAGCWASARHWDIYNFYK